MLEFPNGKDLFIAPKAWSLSVKMINMLNGDFIPLTVKTVYLNVNAVIFTKKTAGY